MPDQTDVPTAIPTTMPNVPLEVNRTEDFESRYANNIQYETSEWDIKMLFGKLDLRGANVGKVAVEQHTAMNIPWVQAKLLIYYLSVQVAIHERLNGQIKIPPSVLPPVPLPLPELFKNNPVAATLRELTEKMRHDYIASLNASGAIATPHKP